MPKGLRRFGSCGRHVRAVTIDQGRTDGTIELRTQFVLTLLPSSVSDERHRLAPVLRCLMDKIDYPSFVRDRCTVPYRSAPGFAPPSARGNADTAAAEIDQIPEWFSQFLNDRQTRKPSAHTMKAYRQGFIAIATLVAGGDPSRLAVTDITKDTMRNAFAAYARDHEAASIRRWWSTWNVLCTFLYTGERLVANPMQLVGQPRLAKPLPKALPRTAVEALLEAVATDQDFRRQTDWAEPDLALILYGAAGRPPCRRTPPGGCGRHPHYRRRSRGDPRQRQRRQGAQRAHRGRTVVGHRGIPHQPNGPLPRRCKAQSGRRGFRPIAMARTIPLFVGRDAERITRGTLQSRIKRAFKRAGPDAQPVPGALVHGLRHTYATELAGSDVSVYTLMKLLGHPPNRRHPPNDQLPRRSPRRRPHRNIPNAAPPARDQRQSTHRAHPRPRRLQTPTHNHSKR